MIGAILGIGSALIGASSASKAADAQEAAAQAQIDLSREQYEDQSERFQPYYDSGLNALAAYNYELGLGPRPTFGATPEPQAVQPSVDNRTISRMYSDNARTATGNEKSLSEFASWIYSNAPNAAPQVKPAPYAPTYGGNGGNGGATGGFEYQGISMSPSARFLLSQGVDAIESSAATGGGLVSGASMAALENRRNNIALSDRDNQLNRLAGLSGNGQNAAGMQATASSNYVNSAGSALANQGNAASAGAIGAGNAIQNGINTGLGVWQYQNQLAGYGGYSGYGGGTTAGGGILGGGGLY